MYNLGAATEKANVDVVHAILELVGKPRTLVQYVKDRPGHDRRYAIDPAKAKHDLGWTATRSFDEALAATVAWYRENRGWWERIISGEYLRYYEKQYGAR